MSQRKIGEMRAETGATWEVHASLAGVTMAGGAPISPSDASALARLLLDAAEASRVMRLRANPHAGMGDVEHAFPGERCGSPGRDVICVCGHRAWLHVGDKEACRSLSGLTCRCAAFQPATDRDEYSYRPHLVPEVPRPTCVEHGLVIRRDGTCGSGCRGLG
jgi:hypothetical protein